MKNEKERRALRSALFLCMAVYLCLALRRADRERIEIHIDG